VVNPQVPAKTLPELVQLIRDNPGKYSFAGPGVGSTPHLGGETVPAAVQNSTSSMSRSRVLHPRCRPFVGGHVPIAFTALPSSLAAIQAGQVRALGVCGERTVERHT